MSRRQDLQSAEDIALRYPGFGVLQQISTSAPTNGAVGYASCCLWQKTGGTTANNTPMLYVNIGSNGFGSNNTAVWTAII